MAWLQLHTVMIAIRDLVYWVKKPKCPGSKHQNSSNWSTKLKHGHGYQPSLPWNVKRVVTSGYK